MRAIMFLFGMFFLLVGVIFWPALLPALICIMFAFKPSVVVRERTRRVWCHKPRPPYSRVVRYRPRDLDGDRVGSAQSSLADRLAKAMRDG